MSELYADLYADDSLLIKPDVPAPAPDHGSSDNFEIFHESIVPDVDVYELQAAARNLDLEVEDGGIKQVLISNLQWWTTDDDLKNLAADCGEIFSLSFQTFPKNGKSRGSAVIEFATSHAAARAVDLFNGMMIHDKAALASLQQTRPSLTATSSSRPAPRASSRERGGRASTYDRRFRDTTSALRHPPSEPIARYDDRRMRDRDRRLHDDDRNRRTDDRPAPRREVDKSSSVRSPTSQKLEHDVRNIVPEAPSSTFVGAPSVHPDRQMHFIKSETEQRTSRPPSRDRSVDKKLPPNPTKSPKTDDDQAADVMITSANAPSSSPQISPARNGTSIERSEPDRSRTSSPRPRPERDPVAQGSRSSSTNEDSRGKILLNESISRSSRVIEKEDAGRREVDRHSSSNRSSRTLEREELGRAEHSRRASSSRSSHPTRGEDRDRADLSRHEGRHESSVRPSHLDRSELPRRDSVRRERSSRSPRRDEVGGAESSRNDAHRYESSSRQSRPSAEFVSSRVASSRPDSNRIGLSPRSLRPPAKDDIDRLELSRRDADRIESSSRSSKPSERTVVDRAESTRRDVDQPEPFTRPLSRDVLVHREVDYPTSSSKQLRSDVKDSRHRERSELSSRSSLRDNKDVALRKEIDRSEIPSSSRSERREEKEDLSDRRTDERSRLSRSSRSDIKPRRDYERREVSSRPDANDDRGQSQYETGLRETPSSSRRTDADRRSGEGDRVGLSRQYEERQDVLRNDIGRSESKNRHRSTSDVSPNQSRERSAHLNEKVATRDEPISRDSGLGESRSSRADKSLISDRDSNRPRSGRSQLSSKESSGKISPLGHATAKEPSSGRNEVRADISDSRIGKSRDARADHSPSTRRNVADNGRGDVRKVSPSPKRRQALETGKRHRELHTLSSSRRSSADDRLPVRELSTRHRVEDRFSGSSKRERERSQDRRSVRRRH